MYMHTYTQTHIYTYTYICTCTYTCIHAHTYSYACTCTLIHRHKISPTTPQRVKKHHRRTYASVYLCMHIHIDMHIHICAPLQRVCRTCVRWYQRNICITYTPAHAQVPRTPVPKCMQHSFQKKAHICIQTHICSVLCTRIHMRMNTHVHSRHRPNAPKNGYWDSQSMHKYAYTYIHTCKYMHTHTYTYTHASIYIYNNKANIFSESLAPNELIN